MATVYFCLFIIKRNITFLNETICDIISWLIRSHFYAKLFIPSDRTNEYCMCSKLHNLVNVRLPIYVCRNTPQDMLTDRHTVIDYFATLPSWHHKLVLHISKSTLTLYFSISWLHTNIILIISFDTYFYTYIVYTLREFSAKNIK